MTAKEVIIAGRRISTKLAASLFMITKLTCIFFLLAFLFVKGTYGQDKKKSQDTVISDSLKTPVPALLAQDSPGSLVIGDSARKFARSADAGTTSLVSKIEAYTVLLNKANAVLKRGFDTLQVTGKLPEFENSLYLIEEFVESKAGISNQRTLNLSKILLAQMERQLNQWQGILQRYSDQLVLNNTLFNAIGSDSILQALPGDSVLRLQYYSQIEVLSRKWVEADRLNKAILYRIAYLQNRVSISTLKVGDLQGIVESGMRNYTQKIFEAEFEYIFGSSKAGKYETGLFESIRKSVRSNNKVFFYYSMSNPYAWLLFIIAGLLFYWWIKKVTRKIRNSTDGEMKVAQTKFLGKMPLTSTVIVTFTLAPFVYANPPMLFTEMLMLVTLLAISWFAVRNWEKKAIQIWSIAVLLFLFFSAINLFVNTTKAERIIFLAVSLFSVWYGNEVRKYLRQSDSRIKKISDLITVMFILLQAFSVIANIMGRYSLAKMFSVTATFGLTQAFVIFYFIEIVIEAIFLELESHRNQSGILSYFDFQDLDKRMRYWLTIFGVTLWGIITLRNLNVYEYIYGIGEEFLVKSRTLGSTQFTFWSIVVFVIVLMLSSFLSRIVGYIFGNPHGSIQGISKGKIGSGVLLIRLGIYTIGIIIAFVASGIPMDKLTIIIGALGVGIGFGLQNVVNNLVSGVILAFEKPIQIGDVVEIGTRMGVVNEIGIRSSKISTYDGSTVIIPNGDLIAQHIVNWTHENKSRRIEVLVGVAYGSDINQCHNIIEEVLQSNKQVIKNPPSLILLEKFGNSSVDFRILFWTGDIGNWVQTKSEIMSAIYQKLDENGISIPFPQQDLHIRSIDPDVAKSLQGGK
jgi:small-conductance mechanosensitive channel